MEAKLGTLESWLSRARVTLVQLAIRGSDAWQRFRRTRAGRYAPWVGYPAFFLTCFLFFAYLTFPYERLKDWIVQQVEYPPGPEGEPRPSGYRLEIVSLEPWWLTGVELQGVRLVRLPQAPGDHPVDATFEEVYARVSILSLLVGDLDVSFSALLAGGEVTGEVELADDASRYAAELDSINLRRIPILRSATGLPLAGVLSGQFDLTVDADPTKSQGAIDLRIAGLEVGDGNAKLKVPGIGGLTIDRMAAGDLLIHSKVENGIADFKELRANGEDIELDGSGSLRLAQPLKVSKLDILISAKIKDAYKERSDRAKTLLSLLEMNPIARSALAPDGALQFRLSGVLGGRFDFRPAGRAGGDRGGRRGRGRGAPGALVGAGTGPSPTPPEATPPTAEPSGEPLEDANEDGVASRRTLPGSGIVPRPPHAIGDQSGQDDGIDPGAEPPAAPEPAAGNDQAP